ncbi:hypothetical protein JCM19239_4150 [Vibrio variabilis]|uniref:Trimeric autotransporter adhesin YadA-like C-terminal membrane anchor domain-containing protein n=1 Tax=Vibrio variabilis TaxID=990271 RepID=A0ABQ0JNY5_9VIBR|nr:hypothetical protein JCM19239_4150 [Vibrio variabilis]
MDAPTAGSVDAKLGDVIDSGEKVAKNLGTHMQDNTTRIGNLENEFIDFKAQAQKRFEELDDRMDMTNASLHAVTNARPMVVNGQTAFGFGTGFAGGANAFAVGVSHSFEDTGWSASATANYSDGAYSNEVSAGAGVQYAF